MKCESYTCPLNKLAYVLLWPSQSTQSVKMVVVLWKRNHNQLSPRLCSKLINACHRSITQRLVSWSSPVVPKVWVVFQPLWWRCDDCVIHHERDVREEQKYMCVARTSNNRVIPVEWSWWVTSNNMLVNLVNSWLCLLTVTTRVISSGDLYCCLLPLCEALCICRWGFPIATVETRTRVAGSRRVKKWVVPRWSKLGLCVFNVTTAYMQSRISCTPYPPIGGPTLSQGPKIQSHHHLTPRKSFDPQIEIWKALEISEVKGPIERKYLHYSYFGPLESKVFTHCNWCLGPLWKESSLLSTYTLQLLLCPFERKLLYTIQLQMGLEASASLALPWKDHCI